MRPKESQAIYMRGWRKTHGDRARQLVAISQDKRRFGGLRKQVLERDGHKCQNCGMTDQEHNDRWNRGLTIDHIDNQGRYSDKPNNSLDNLVTLCLACHGRKDVMVRWNKIKGGI